jgi:hypothetical protein
MTGRARGLPALLIALALAGLFAGGCSTDPTEGYTLEPLHETSVASVAVPIWTRGRHIYRRDIEFRLTEAVRKRVLMDTPYKVLPRDRADSELVGTIENISQYSLSGNPYTGRARETEITMVLSFTWKDLRTGRTIRKLSNFRVASTYIRGGDFNEDFFQGSEDVINKAARRIVEQMEREM